MGEDTCIYVKKNKLKSLYWTTEKLINFGNRWYSFEDKLKLESYPENRNYWTAEEILLEIAGKEIDMIYVEIIKDLVGKKSIIQGDYQDFPNDKNEEDYVDLTILFYKLFNDFAKLQGDEK